MPPSYRQTNSSRYTVNGRGGERVPGNGRDRYADVEAVRVLAEGMTGFENLVHEA
jgi:hypothetical protein